MGSPFSNLHWRWTLGWKIGGLATLLLLLLGGVSTYFHFEIQAVGREIEEIGESDFPIYETAAHLWLALNQQNSLAVQVVTLAQMPGQEARMRQRVTELQQWCDRTHHMLETGKRHIEYAIQQEQAKDGAFRLNQTNEDYPQIQRYFAEIEQKHQALDGIINQILNQVTAGDPQDIADLSQQLEQELAEIEPVLAAVQAILQQHVNSSVKATKAEKLLALTTNSIIALLSVALGIAISSLVIRRITASVNQITQKAQHITGKIAQECFETEHLVVDSTDEIADLAIAFNQMVDNFCRSRDALKQIEANLFAEKELAQITLRSIADAIIATGIDGRIFEFNPIAEQLTGWQRDLALGQQLDRVLQLVDIEQRQPLRLELMALGRHLPDVNPTTEKVLPIPLTAVDGLGTSDLPSLLPLPADKLWERSQRTEGWHQDIALTWPELTLPSQAILLHKTGREFWISFSVAPIRAKNDRVVGMAIAFHDITQERQIAQQLSWQACHDPLTELLNRREFEHQLVDLLQGQDAGASEHSLLYLDLDRFKIVNDTCGHAAGDALLKQVAAVLRSHIRTSDILARLGGDEFAIILQNCSLSAALNVAQKLLRGVQDFCFIWQDRAFSIGISIGLVSCQPNQDSLTDLLKTADTACYAAKNNGRNQIYVVRDKQQQLARQSQEMNWIVRINQALDANQFCLFYQPIVALQQEQPEEHYEILVRLREADNGLVPPMAFIPTAERYGLMGQIERWVIQTTFQNQSQHYRQQFQQGQTQQDGYPTYGINLSGETLNDERFIDFLKAQLYRYQIPPQVLCFEITETVAISNLQRVSVLLEQLRTLGCRFALDDFGSGMSSFGYLKHLPVDYIKIDGSFVRELASNTVDAAIVRAIGQVACEMHIATIAESVEETQTLQKLRALGIDYGQGYGIARPQPLVRSHAHSETASDQN